MRQPLANSCAILKHAHADVQLVRATRVDVMILFPVPCLILDLPDELYREVSLIGKFASHQVIHCVGPVT